jgi:prepilin-type N-terminal cleavage/methylation domain-containing protein
MRSRAWLARSSRGFTLIELMIVVAILGILASIAMPELSRMTYRAKLTERAVIMDRIKKGVADLYLRNGQIPDNLTGWFNPPLPPGSARRTPDWSQAGWNQILAGMGDIEGGLYYSYYFWVWESTTPPLLLIYAIGDVDGDGVQSTKWIYYQRVQGSYQLWSEWPPAGQDDVGVF